MTNHKILKISALIAVAAFVSVFAVTHFRPVESTEPFDIRSSVVKTTSDINTEWDDNVAKIVFEQTTKYYGKGGSAKYVMDTKIECDSVLNDNVMNMKCKCTAKYNDEIATCSYQNGTAFSSTESKQEMVEEIAKEYADQCIDFGAEQFFGLD